MADYVTPVNQYLKTIDLQAYDRYLPNAFNDSLTLLEKINKMIHQMNESSKLTNEIIKQWNDFVTLINDGGLIDSKINEKLNDNMLIELIDKELMVDFKKELNEMTSQKITTINDELNEVTSKIPTLTTKEYVDNQVKTIPKGEKGDPGTASIAIDDGVTNTSQTWSSGKIVEQLNSKTDFLVPVSPNLFNPNESVIGKKIGADGTLQDDPNYNVSGFISVQEGESYQTNIVETGGSYHDGNGNFIKRIPWNEPKPYVVPLGLGIKSMRISYGKTAKVMVNKGDTLLPYTPYSPDTKLKETVKISIQNMEGRKTGKKFVSFGDSLVGYNLWQPMVTNYFGFTHYMRGIGSTTVVENGSVAWFDSERNYLARPDNGGTRPPNSIELKTSMSNDDRISTIPIDAEIIILLGSANDFFNGATLGETIDFTNTNEFKSAYAITIKKIQTRCPNARIFTMTLPPNNTFFKGNAKGRKTWEFANAIKEVSNLMSVPCIDLFGKCGWNESNSSIYLADHVHPTDKGFTRMGEIIIKEMDGLV